MSQCRVPVGYVSAREVAQDAWAVWSLLRATRSGPTSGEPLRRARGGPAQADQPVASRTLVSLFRQRRRATIDSASLGKISRLKRTFS